MNKKYGKNKQIIRTIELKQKRRFKHILHEAVVGYVNGKVIRESKKERIQKKEPIVPKIKKHKGVSSVLKKRIYRNYEKVYGGTLHQCIFCGKDIDSHDIEEYTLDHLVPFSLGGANNEENLKPCCLTCNREKAGFTIDEWLNILQREFERTGESDPHIFYKFMRVRDVKRYVDRMGERLYVKQ